MRLTLSVPEKDAIIPIEVSPEMTFGDLKAYIEIESGIPAGSQLIYHSSRPVQGNEAESIEVLKFEEDDVITVSAVTQEIPGTTTASSAGSATSGNPMAMMQQAEQQISSLRAQLLSNPTLREQFISQNASRGITEDVINNEATFRQKILEIQMEAVTARFRREQELAKLEEDPYNEESQRRIMELIRENQIAENLEQALEHTPEVFTQVDMLYIKVNVNGYDTQAFVDSGAQMTIMSPDLLEKCGLDRLLDRRYQGVARGVGSGKIIGRVHSAPIKIGNLFLPCSFTVLEHSNRGAPDLLLGLDMLKRHQGIIDLKRNVLVFGEAETPFLQGHEIKREFDDFESLGTAVGNSVGNAANKTMAASSAAASAAAARATAQANTLPVSNSSTERPPSSSASSTFPEADISQLVSLGFTREQAITALKQTNGNVDYAASLLFQ